MNAYAMRTVTKYAWKLVLDIPKGHRIFQESEGRGFAVADRSGSLPHNTEDGVLWVDGLRPLRLSSRSSLGTPSFDVPVKKEREPEGNYWVCCDVSYAPEIVNLLGTTMEVTCPDKSWMGQALLAHLQNLRGVLPLVRTGEVPERQEEGARELLRLRSGTGTRDLRVFEPTIPGSYPAVGVQVGTALYTTGPREARRVAQALLAAADKAEELKR